MEEDTYFKPENTLARNEGQLKSANDHLKSIAKDVRWILFIVAFTASFLLFKLI